MNSKKLLILLALALTTSGLNAPAKPNVRKRSLQL